MLWDAISGQSWRYKITCCNEVNLPPKKNGAIGKNEKNKRLDDKKSTVDLIVWPEMNQRKSWKNYEITYFRSLINTINVMMGIDGKSSLPQKCNF
jgi:hypothetical protein